MDGQQEQKCSEDMRNLARQYAEGRFNKEEYRNRRRDLIAKCSGEDATLLPVPDAKGKDASVDDERGMRWIRVIGGVSLALMVVMGYVIYSLNG